MKILVMAVSLALASSVSNAQSDDSAAAATGGGEGTHRATLHEELGLTEEQRNQIREIRQSGGSREDIRAVLTPEQQARAQAAMKAHRPDIEERTARMKEHLGLSDDQVAQIKAIRKAGGSREEIRAVLTPAQQQKFDEMRQRRKGANGAKGVKGAGSTESSPAEKAPASE